MTKPSEDFDQMKAMLAIPTIKDDVQPSEVDELFKKRHAEKCILFEIPEKWFDEQSIKLCNCWVKDTLPELYELLVSEAVSCEFIVDDNGFRVIRISQKAIPLEAINRLFGVKD